VLSFRQSAASNVEYAQMARWAKIPLMKAPSVFTQIGNTTMNSWEVGSATVSALRRELL
jgi:hypothetical protein